MGRLATSEAARRISWAESTDVRPLDSSRLDDAVALVADAVADIPLYRWLLGDHAADPEYRTWLSTLLVRPLLTAGCATGAFDGDDLVGVLLWQPPDLDTSVDGRPPLTPADVDLAARTPGLRERLVDLWTSDPLPRPADDTVCCVLTAVTPDRRGSRLVMDMMAVVEDHCREHGRRFYAWTGSPALRDWFVAGWGTTVFETVEWNGVTVYGVLSS